MPKRCTKCGKFMSKSIEGDLCLTCLPEEKAIVIQDVEIPRTEMAQITEVKLEDGTTIKPHVGDKKVLIVKPTPDVESWQLIPLVKSKRYTYMDHRYAAQTFVDAIETQIHDPAIVETFGNVDVNTEVQFNKRYDRMHIRCIPRLEYTLKGVKPFESYLKTTYVENNEIPEDEKFSPMITLINDFDGCPKVSFGLYRWVCTNGMFSDRKMLNTIYFKHTDKNLKETFKDQVNQFIINIFENRLVEEMFERMEQHKLKVDTLREDIEQNIGKRAVKYMDETFELTEEQISAWIAYNIITWILTHRIKDRQRAMALAAMYSEKVTTL